MAAGVDWLWLRCFSWRSGSLMRLWTDTFPWWIGKKCSPTTKCQLRGLLACSWRTLEPCIGLCLRSWRELGAWNHRLSSSVVVVDVLGRLSCRSRSILLGRCEKTYFQAWDLCGRYRAREVSKLRDRPILNYMRPIRDSRSRTIDILTILLVIDPESQLKSKDFRNL